MAISIEKVLNLCKDSFACSYILYLFQNFGLSYCTEMVVILVCTGFALLKKVIFGVNFDVIIFCHSYGFTSV